MERLKTIYLRTGIDKKGSIELVLDKVSKGDSEFRSQFETEFKELTGIGNRFRIRHHERDKIDIVDDNYFDYFFNRCLSLMSLTLKFV